MLSRSVMSNSFWTIAYGPMVLWSTPQAPLSMGVSRQESGVGHHFLLHGIFPTQGSNPGLLLWQVDSLPPNHLRNQILLGEEEGKSYTSNKPIYFYFC